MNKFSGILKIQSYENRKNLFLNDREADVFYLIGTKLAARCRKILTESLFFQNKFLEQDKRVYKISEDIDVSFP